MSQISALERRRTRNQWVPGCNDVGLLVAILIWLDKVVGRWRLTIVVSGIQHVCCSSYVQGQAAAEDLGEGVKVVRVSGKQYFSS